MLRLESYKYLTPEKRCANTSSATDSEEAAGVFMTWTPLLFA